MPRVLVADDYPDAAEGLALLLECWGYQPVKARDGASALEAAEAHRPDAALLDIDLPGLDGCEVARRLRRLPGMARALLVAVSRYGSAEVRRRYLEAGFDHFLVKPADPEELRRLVARAVGR